MRVIIEGRSPPKIPPTIASQCTLNMEAGQHFGGMIIVSYLSLFYYAKFE